MMLTCFYFCDGNFPSVTLSFQNDMADYVEDNKRIKTRGKICANAQQYTGCAILNLCGQNKKISKKCNLYLNFVGFFMRNETVKFICL